MNSSANMIERAIIHIKAARTALYTDYSLNVQNGTPEYDLYMARMNALKTMIVTLGELQVEIENEIY